MVKTYPIRVCVGDGRNEEQFVEFYTITTKKTPKDIVKAWVSCKAEFPDGWETSQLVTKMRDYGYDMECSQDEPIELEA